MQVLGRVMRRLLAPTGGELNRIAWRNEQTILAKQSKKLIELVETIAISVKPWTPSTNA